MNQALTKKLGVIEIKREAEIKEKEKLEKNDSKEKSKKSSSPKQRRRRASIAYIGTEKESRKNSSTFLYRNSLIDQERKLHEAYQLILAEHHKRLNQRHGSIQYELEGARRLSSFSLSHQPCPCLRTVETKYEGNHFLFSFFSN